LKTFKTKQLNVCRAQKAARITEPMVQKKTSITRKTWKRVKLVDGSISLQFEESYIKGN
jgi:hypothetical protein